MVQGHSTEDNGQCGFQQGCYYIVIKSVAVGQYVTSVSLTATNGLSQEKLIHRALKDGDISGEDVGYLESHSTSTLLK